MDNRKPAIFKVDCESHDFIDIQEFAESLFDNGECVVDNGRWLGYILSFPCMVEFNDNTACIQDLLGEDIISSWKLINQRIFDYKEGIFFEYKVNPQNQQYLYIDAFSS